MTKLKLGDIDDDKPVKLAVELPAAVHRDLLAYAEVLARETGQPIADPSKLVATDAGSLHGHGPGVWQGYDEKIRSKARDSVPREASGSSLELDCRCQPANALR